MAALERGGLANPDEKRMVGHYWLRAPERAPTPEIAAAIRETQARVLDFAARVHDGRVSLAGAGRFRHLLVIGIGGSALGPQLVADALGGRGDRMQPHFLDNTDPDGFDRVLGRLGGALGDDARARDLEVGRHARRRATACWKRPRPTPRAASTSPATRSRSRRTAARSTARPASRASSSASRCGTGWAGARP